jgi:hypothetical protein
MLCHIFDDGEIKNITFQNFLAFRKRKIFKKFRNNKHSNYFKIKILKYSKYKYLKVLRSLSFQRRKIFWALNAKLNQGNYLYPWVIRVEAESNTSTVTLRVVGGDENGSLKSETVKYGRKSLGTTTEKDCAGKGQRHTQKTDPSSRQRGRPTEWRT